MSVLIQSASIIFLPKSETAHLSDLNKLHFRNSKIEKLVRMDKWKAI